MSFLDFFRLRKKQKLIGTGTENLQEENRDYMKEYKSAKKALQSDIKRYTGLLNLAREKFNEMEEEALTTGFISNIHEYDEAKDSLTRWQIALADRKGEIKFVRPNKNDDIEYRDKQLKEFTTRLKEVISQDLDLRFHGTPIYRAKQIIKSMQISSSADRHQGYIQSSDTRGEISVSSINSLDRTINFFSDMISYQRSLPAGVIFALQPKDKEDAEYGINSDTMHSVDFKKNPQQLFGIFTTPENIKRVKKWCESAGLNSDTVYTFEEFIDAVKNKSQELEGKKQLSNTIRVDVPPLDTSKIESTNDRSQQTEQTL